MRRVLILCEYPTLLGGERSMLATLPAVRAAGFDVHVAAPGQGPLAAELREHGIDHHAWPERSHRATMLPSELLRGSLERIIRRIQPVIVHANSLSTSRIAGPVVTDAAIPSLGHLRDIVKLSRRAVADVNLHRRIAAVSHATLDFHVGQGLDAARSIVLYNGVDLDEFRPRAATGYVHRELQLPASAQLVANIGQIALRKGTPAVLYAAQQIADERSDLHWVIVGERKSTKLESQVMEMMLRGIASQPPLDGRIHFLGTRRDVPQILNECVILVHAARQEPLGRVLLEAAASGVAVVATDVGGTREIFPSRDEAVLVPPDDGVAMAKATLDLLRDEPRRRGMASAARRRAEEAFDIRHAAPRVVAQYEEVLNG
jgi:glycosyltransferase involved in cell wall biosynthesis